MTNMTERGPGSATGLRQAAASAWSNEIFELVLFPTEQCNFRCTYCYEDFAIGRMRPQVVAGVKALVERRASELRQLRVLWFGGEPLAAYDLVRDLSRYFHRLAIEFGFDHSGDLTTNGFLLDERRLAELCALGANNFQISLDGPAKVHDRTRKRANGKGSFAEIWRNLIAARQSDTDFRILLRVHLTPENAASMHDFVRTLRDELLCDPRFNLFFMPIARLGGAGDDDMAVLGNKRGAELISELQALLTEGMSDEVDGVNTGLVEERPAVQPQVDVCYAAKPNSLMIRADGTIGKCTVALASDSNRVGRILPDGSVEVDSAKVLPWMSGWSSGNLGELTCPLNTVEAFRT